MTVVTAWTDFATGELGIIHACEGHSDGWFDDYKVWRPTVTCPFHILATLDFAQYSRDQDQIDALQRRQERQQARQQEREQRKKIAVEMATTSLFAANEAATLMPLRQQIIANATVLFPAVVKGKHNTLFRWGHASPDVLFEIAILATSTNSEAHSLAEGAGAATKFQAILTHGLVTKQQTAAMGDMSGTVTGAMESLLGVLCFELGKRKNEAVEAIADGARVKSLGGFVNGGLFQKVGLAKKVRGKKA